MPRVTRARLRRRPRPSTGTVAAAAALLGVVGGIRSQAPLAMLGAANTHGRFAEGGPTALALLRSNRVKAGLTLAAVGELVGDKLPITPSRLSPGPFAGRLLFGGLAGAAAFVDGGRAPLVGAALGATGAAAGAAGGYVARDTLTRATPVPDVVWAGLEDGVALALGIVAVRPWTSR